MYASDYRKKAWLAMHNNWGKMAVITLVYLALGSIVTSFGSVLGMLVVGPMYLSWAMISLRIVRLEEVKVDQLFDGFHNFAEAFLLYLLNNLLIFAWSLLFVIPGIVKAHSYAMSTYILAENPGMTQNEARKRSMEMMEGHKFDLFCLRLSFIGWYLLCILTAGILYLWVMPYQQAADAAFYEELKKGERAPVNPAEF